MYKKDLDHGGMYILRFDIIELFHGINLKYK